MSSGPIMFAVANQSDKRVSATDPLPVGLAAGSAGSSSTTPQYVTAAQGTPVFNSIPVAANTSGSLFTADANRRGARLLNYTASPIYFDIRTSGDPASGAPSDVVPAATGGLPGQYEFPYAPTGAYRYIGAGAGSGLTALVTEVW